MSQASDAQGADLSGQLLDGRYRIEKVVARGGMATIYLAMDERLSRPVALKVPHAALLATPGFRERFQEEIRSLTTLSHPNIIEIIDVGEVDDLPYAVLQYVEASTLENRMAGLRRPMTPAEVLWWLAPAAGALDFIHGQGLLHRDIKPENIMFDGSGNVYLTDFGIVKALGEKPSRHSVAGGRPGSPAYMGPEVATDTVLGPGYDLYGLGVTVYEALGGVLPWRGESEVKALTTKLKADVPSLPPSVAPALDRVVRQAMARKPKERQTSCQAFADAFAAAAGRQAPVFEDDAAPRPAPAAPPRKGKKAKAGSRGSDTWHGSPGDSTKSGTPTERPLDSQTRSYDPSRPPASALGEDVPDPEAEEYVRVKPRGSETRAIDVTARARKGPSKGLMIGVGAMVLLLVVAIIAKMGGKEEGVVALAAPKVKITSPRPDIVLNDPKVAVRGTVSASVSSVLVNDVEAEISKALTFGVELDLAEEGIHQIKVVAKSADGQTVESFSRITLDQTAPVIKILKPEATAAKSRRVPEFEIVGSLDDKTSRVYYGDERLVLDEEGWFTLYKSLRTEGLHTYEFRAVDRAGNESHAKVEVIFDQTEPRVSIRSPGRRPRSSRPRASWSCKGRSTTSQARSSWRDIPRRWTTAGGTSLGPPWRPR